MMSNFLSPERKPRSISKEFGIEEIVSEKSMRFRLFHIDRLANQKQHERTSPEKDMSLMLYFQNKGILSSIRKLNKRQVHIMKSKLDLYQQGSHLTEHIPNGTLNQTKIIKGKERAITLSHKRFSTCTNNAESIQPSQPEEQQFCKHQKKCSTLESTKSKGMIIRVSKRKKRITIKELLEQKYKKQRQYEFSKLSRTDIIPDYLLFSKKVNYTQEKKLIKNISEKVYPYYRVSPNCIGLQN